jgi:hypothetical protein
MNKKKRNYKQTLFNTEGLERNNLPLAIEIAQEQKNFKPYMENYNFDSVAKKMAMLEKDKVTKEKKMISPNFKEKVELHQKR